MSQTLTQALSVLLGVIASLGITALLIYIFVASSGQGRWSGSQAERTAYYLDRVADESLDRARQHWQRAGRTIRFGPVKAFYCGDQPDNLNRFTPDAGALAIVDARLVFRSASSANFEIDLPLESIRWFGQANVTVQQFNALTFYVEPASRWRLYTIGVEDVEGVNRALQDIGGLALNPDPDYGPVNVLRCDQNIYGHWVPDHTVRLYLIPDHVLADWRTVVRFDQIQGLAVLPSGGLSPAGSALLSIHYTADDGRPRGVGFALGWSKAFVWAAMLEERTGVEREQVERKKKIG
jgi:hypothetical protein